MSKRKAALSRSCVTRVVHERKRRGEELRYISEWGGRKEERLPSRKKCTLEIKKLSLQLFHNSLDFRAGEQRGLCPSPARNLPATFPSRSPLIFPGIRYNPPIEVQSPYRFCGNIYIYIYISTRVRCNNAFDDICHQISAGCLHRDTIPFYGFPWKIRDESPPFKKSHHPLITSIINLDDEERILRKIFLLIIKKK